MTRLIITASLFTLAATQLLAADQFKAQVANAKTLTPLTADQLK